jgi:hypothetical protein
MNSWQVGPEAFELADWAEGGASFEWHSDN